MINKLNDILLNLINIEGITSTLIVDKDGLLITQLSNDEHILKNDLENLAPLFAQAIQTYEPLLKSIGHSGIKQITIQRENNEQLILCVQENFILAVITKGKVNLGLIRMEIKETIKQLLPLLN